MNATLPAPRATSRARVGIALLILLLIGAALPVITYPLGRDQGEFAVIGRGLLDGKRPYVDLWNPKPPAVFAVYAGAMTLFGRTSASLRALDLIVFAAIILPVYALGVRVGGRRVGVWAIVLFAVCYFTETFWTLTQNDGIALVPMVWAVYAAIQAGERGGVWALVAGALTGIAVWFKYPFALIVIPVVAAYWLTGSGKARQPIRQGTAFVIGGAMVIAAGSAWLIAVGAWDAFIESALLTARYTALGATESGNLFAVGIATRLQHWAALWLLLMVAVIWRLPGFGTPNPTDRVVGSGFGTLYTMLWLLVGLAIMAVQLKGYDYHWLPMLPPLALIGAHTLDRIIGAIAAKRTRVHNLIAWVVGAAAIGWLVVRVWGTALPYISGAIDRTTYDAGFVAGDFHADESRQMAQFLRERVAPGDSLFIWGFRPEVYTMSGLTPAARFIFNFPLIAPWYPAAWRAQTVETLWAALPPYVLILESDYMPWVTGSNDDSHTLLLEYTDLRGWLEFNYERDETQIGSFIIWRRLSR